MRKPKIPRSIPSPVHNPEHCTVCSAATKSHHRREMEMVPRPRHRAPGTAAGGDYSGRHRLYEGRHRR